MAKAKIILFKPNGKYYTEEYWEIPSDKVIGPNDMERSPDFRRIDNGPVLVETQEPWGYPHLFPQVVNSNLKHYSDIYAVSHYVNAAHIVRVTFNRRGLYEPWEATIILSNGDTIRMIDENCATLTNRVMNGDN